MWSNHHRHTCQSILGWRWSVFYEITGSLPSFVFKNAPFVAKLPDFVMLTQNDHIIFTSSSHSYQSFVIKWSNDHRHIRQLLLGWKSSALHEIMGSLQTYITKIVSFVYKWPDFAILTKNDRTIFTIFSHSHQCFVILWSNDHTHMCQSILGWRCNVLQKLMGSLHRYIAKIAPFFDKAPDFVNLTKNYYIIFTNSAQSYNAFVIM